MASETQFASEEELTRIAELRAALEPELRELKAKGLDFPHVVGDIFMTRLLRGCHGDLTEAIDWYRRFVEIRVKHGLDDVHRDCETKKLLFKPENMPGMLDTMRKYFYSDFDEEALVTNTKNILWYDAFRLSDPVGAKKNLDFETADKCFKYMYERRTSRADSLSRDVGKLVKSTRILDIDRCNLSKAVATAKFSKPWDDIAIAASVEMVHLVFIINSPGWVVNVFHFMKMRLPPRVREKFRILGTDYLQNPEFLAEVSPSLMKTMLSRTPASDKAEYDDEALLEGTLARIPAVAVMERIVEVTVGQQVTWDFRVGTSGETATNRGFFGKIASAATGAFSGAELVFSVNAIWTDRMKEEIKTCPVKVRSAGLDHGDTAEFWVDDTAVDFKPGPGINVVAVNPMTRAEVLAKNYDVTSDADAANDALVKDLADLPKACLVLLAVKGTGAELLTELALDALKAVGSTLEAGRWHEGYALIGSTNGTTIQEAQGKDVVAQENALCEDMEEILVKPYEVNPSTGDVKGSVKADRSGMIIVKWSNYHSFVTQKSLAHFKVSVE